MNNLLLHRLGILLLIFLLLGLGWAYQKQKELLNSQKQTWLQDQKNLVDSLDQGYQTQIQQFKTRILADSLFITGDYEQALEHYAQFIGPDGDSSLLVLRQTRVEVLAESPKVVYRYIRNQNNGAIDSLAQVIEKLQIQQALQQGKLQRQIQALENEKQKTEKELQASEIEKKRLAEAYGTTKFKSRKGTDVQYWGQLKEGKAEGEGFGLWASGSYYEGQWKANQRQGQGRYVWADGEHYEGEFQEDQRHGQGKYTWKNGEYYIGNWVKDHREGKGILYDKKGKVKFDGEWRKDEFVSKNKENNEAIQKK